MIRVKLEVCERRQDVIEGSRHSIKIKVEGE